MHVRRRVFLPAHAMDGYKLQTDYKPTTKFVVVKTPVTVRKIGFLLQNYKKFPINPYARVRSRAPACAFFYLLLLIFQGFFL